MPKDSPGQIAKLQLNNMGYSGQATVQMENVLNVWNIQNVLIAWYVKKYVSTNIFCCLKNSLDHQNYYVKVTKTSTNNSLIFAKLSPSF